MGSTADARDYDLEVYGSTAPRCAPSFRTSAASTRSARAFTVYKIGDIDVSIRAATRRRGTAIRGSPSWATRR